MITDERLRHLSKPDYAQSESGQITAELLAARVLLRAWLEELSGDDEDERIAARKLLGLRKGWPHELGL